MSALRICVVALVLASSVASAAMTCGTAPSKNMYGNSTISCAAAVNCQSTYCSCVGGTHSSGLTCTAGSTAPNCTHATWCVGQLTMCLNKASNNATGCPGLKDLHMSLLSVESGKAWNASMAWTSCVYQSCMLLNASMASGNCTMDKRRLCPSPVVFVGTLVLSGNFTGILNSATARAKLTKALEVDLIAVFKIDGIWVARLFVLGTSPTPAANPAPQRQGNQEALIVEFRVPGVSDKNTDVKTHLATIKADKQGTLLKATAAEYSSFHGGSGTIGVLGVAAGAGSSAFSSGALNNLKPTTGAPPVPTVSTPTPNVGTPTPSAGAGMQSLLAAIVVAVLSAMLI